MRLSPEEKAEIIEVVKNSDLGINRTLKQLGIHKRTFYNWYHAYSQEGIEGLKTKRNQRQQWNSIPIKSNACGYCFEVLVSLIIITKRT